MVFADAQTLKQGLGSLSRNLTPPAHLEIDDAEVDGVSVITARVEVLSTEPEAMSRLKREGLFEELRRDYPLSELESTSIPAFENGVTRGQSLGGLGITGSR